MAKLYYAQYIYINKGFINTFQEKFAKKGNFCPMTLK